MNILTKIENGVAYITLHRPEKYNSVNRELALGLQAALDACATNDEVRAILLSGAGKGFCAGQDLGEVIEPGGPQITHIVSEHYNPIIEKIVQLKKPVICAVNGVAAGAGANIALACDIVVAAESATFIQAFSKIGLIPDSAGTYFLPRLIGRQKAMALMMLADKVTAQEAESIGMIYKYFSDDILMMEAEKIAVKLAQMPTVALAYTKMALNASENNTLEEQLALEGKYQKECSETEDFKEGINAFLEKRSAVFTGK